MGVKRALDHHLHQKAVQETTVYTVFGTSGVNGAPVLLVLVAHLEQKHVREQSGRRLNTIW